MMNENILTPKAIQLMGRIVHRLARKHHKHISLSGSDAVNRILVASDKIEDQTLQIMRSELEQESH